jgi:hypothetical protein
MDARPRIPFASVAKFGLFAAFASVLWYLSVALLIACIPLVFLHRVLVCVLGWFTIANQAKRVLVIETKTEHSAQWIARIRALTDGRETLLDYDDRSNWSYWSFDVHLFNAFGPIAIAQFFTPRALPAVIIIKKFRWPRMFAVR